MKTMKKALCFILSLFVIVMVPATAMASEVVSPNVYIIGENTSNEPIRLYGKDTEVIFALGNDSPNHATRSWQHVRMGTAIKDGGRWRVTAQNLSYDPIDSISFRVKLISHYGLQYDKPHGDGPLMPFVLLPWEGYISGAITLAVTDIVIIEDGIAHKAPDIWYYT